MSRRFPSELVPAQSSDQKPARRELAATVRE